MENKNRQTNKLSIFFKTLAFSVFFTGLTSGCATPINNHKEETKIESNEEIEVDDVEVKEDDEYSKLLIDELDNYSIIDYKGNSLAEALTLCGYDISFETRKSLAETFGIDDYTGTIKQDNELLNILKENKIESLAKVSDIKDICKKLFKYDQDKIIEYLKLPKTLNITRSDFSRVIREIAGKLNVDINYDNDKLSTALDNVKDVNKLSMNRNNIAWAYLMGYMDLDDNYNFNGNEYVTVKDFNLWLKTFTNDYNKAIEKQTNNDKKIIIAPSKDIVNIKDKEVENKTPEDNNKDKFALIAIGIYFSVILAAVIITAVMKTSIFPRSA